MALDFDLSSIQEARDLVRKAKHAYEEFSDCCEKSNDKIVAAMAQATEENAQKLASMAVEETSYGVMTHKVMKNLFAAKDVYNHIKHEKTIGIIREDKEKKVVEVAVPIGVILGITPTTNPTSTVIHNALCSVKARNPIVFSPHPNAVKCSAAAAQILNDAAVSAGAPDGLVGCLTQASKQATDELMHHEDISAIIATGGSAMVRAAYSVGKPAFGVGPGNVPAFIERSADIRQAVKDIIISKSFDNGMICASEQAILADEPIKNKIIEEFKRNGGHFLSEDEVKKVSTTVMTPQGSMVAGLIGRTAQYIGEKAGICVPSDAKVLIAPLGGYGKGYPLSHEKLTSVLGFYTVKNWHEACELSIELLKMGGIGHSFSIHSQDDSIVREFIRKPVFRILVNTPSTFGAIGYSTGLEPSMTLGCGTWGGSSISDNLSAHHLVNIKRLVYGTRKVDLGESEKGGVTSAAVRTDEIAELVKQVLRQLKVS